MWSHEESYQGRGIIPFFHRRRLKSLFELFDRIDLKKEGALADFGCSNGYILSLLRKNVFRDKDYEFHGFDHSEELIESARSRGIPNTSFHYVDLNRVADADRTWVDRFDIVTCFETIEHTGNSMNAFHNLYSACKAEGVIFLSMPNEKGLPGLLKFFGRKILRRDPYGDFFENTGEFEYVRCLLMNRRIDGFRDPEAESWGPHLGFDWQVILDSIREKYIRSGMLELLCHRRSVFGLNLLVA